MNKKETLDKVKNDFEKSVKYHMESDVPVGLFLSGGIDSTSILTVASKFSKINTLSIGLEEKRWDESYTSKMIADYYGSNHYECIIKENDIVECLDDFVNTLDQPTVDGFNTYFISKFSNQLGFKVVLSGLGGDELFGGYSSFLRMNIVNHGLNIKNNILPKRISKSLNRISKSLIASKLLRKQESRIIDLIDSDNLFDSYIAIRGIFSKNEALNIMKEISDNEINSLLDINENSAGSDSINSKTRTLELNNYLKNQLLRDSDIFGMRWSTEIRTPFVDYNFVSIIKSLPEKYIFQKNKKALTEALELPIHLMNTKKQGFSFPWQLWSKNYFGNEIKKEIPSTMQNYTEWYKLWAIFVLKKWIKNNV